jgi:hypothetical protein
VSGTTQTGAGSVPATSRTRANLTARFTLHADGERDVAQAAAELIRRLQEMASLPDCAYELDVDVQWPAAKALSPGGESAPPLAGPPSDSC